jgi:hypothetical protein
MSDEFRPRRRREYDEEKAPTARPVEAAGSLLTLHSSFL